MSGYQRTELVLAGRFGADEPTIDQVRAYLLVEHDAEEAACYLVQEPWGPTGLSEIDESLSPTGKEIATALEVGYGVRLDCEIRIARFRHLAALCIAPVSEAERSVTLKLESSVIDAVYRYDRALEEFDDEAKLGVLRLCVGLTAAARADGFLLMRDETKLTHMRPEEVASEMRERKRQWHIAGVRQQLLTLEELRRIKKSKDPAFIFTSTTGLTIYDLVHSMKY